MCIVSRGISAEHHGLSAPQAFATASMLHASEGSVRIHCVLPVAILPQLAEIFRAWIRQRDRVADLEDSEGNQEKSIFVQRKRPRDLHRDLVAVGAVAADASVASATGRQCPRATTSSR